MKGITPDEIRKYYPGVVSGREVADKATDERNLIREVEHPAFVRATACAPLPAALREITPNERNLIRKEEK